MVFIDKLPFGRERSVRAVLTIVCEARQGVQPWQRVRLNDLSPQGFRVTWKAPLNQRQPLWLRIPGMAPLSAHIRWLENGVLGCEFQHPLHIAVFEHIVANAY